MSRPLYDYDELETEEQFLAVVARFPSPVPEELRPVYRRLRQFGARRGWAWPYRRYMPASQRLTRPVPAIEAHPTVANQYQAEAARARKAPPEPPRRPAERTAEHEANWGLESEEHLCFDGEYEWFRGDTGDVWRGWRGWPMDRYGYRSKSEYMGKWHEHEAYLLPLINAPRAS